jgi:CubicO group peptidase (beta-lactamase class C family)
MNSFAFFISIVGYLSIKSYAAADLPRSTPELQGISSEAINQFVRAADEQVNAMNSFMLVRHGHVVAEGWWTPYGPEIPHTLFSLSKSFTSTAVGLAIADGKLSIDDEVLKFFPEDAPANPTNNLKSMRVHDLLRMSTGHETEPRFNNRTDEPWTKIFLAHPVPHKPGTHFLYNTAGTYMQSAIVQKVTGQTLFEYLRPRLFEPLGIENPRWGSSPQGINYGGYGLDIRTEDIAKFGQLYLQKGQWNGKQLIPPAWVEAATARQTSNGSDPKSDWDQGYGYQFWRCRHDAYRGDGAFGQYCIVLPEEDAVIAITSGTRDMQAVLNLIWDKLLPAFGASTLPDNPAQQEALKKKLANLSLPTPEGSATSDAVSKLAGEFQFESNPQKFQSLRLQRGSNGLTLHFKVDGRDYVVPCRYKEWSKSRLAYGQFTEQPVAASGAWNADGSYSARLCFYETPTFMTITLAPKEGQLVYDAEYNIAFGATKQPQLIGKLMN